MAEELRHIRYFTSRLHCGCEILPTDTFEIPYLEIERISVLKADDFLHKHDKIELHFKPNPYTDLPMLLNSTNLKTIYEWLEDIPLTDTPNEKRMLSDYPTQWLSRGSIAIKLTRTKVKNPKGRGKVWGLYISKTRPSKPTYRTAPKAKIVLTPESEKWQGAKDFIKGGKTIEDLRVHYDISDEHAEMLTAE